MTLEVKDVGDIYGARSNKMKIKEVPQRSSIKFLCCTLATSVLNSLCHQVALVSDRKGYGERRYIMGPYRVW